ncbi:MAG: signal peptidase II [Aestuariivirga sp.]|uniref:signal peptidase II n=1 Tax=Aestuariivirga sp. TaxID=2650926 RepID=UPI0030162A98
MKWRLWGPLAPLTLGLAIIVFGLDQLHKYWMLDVYGIIEKAPVRITNFFDLVMVWNTGVSYGLFSTHVQEWLIALTLGIALMLWIWACGARHAMAAAALGMVIGGALGNAFDRLFRGAVADFFLFHYQNFSWYVFNVADIAIVAGVAMLMYESVVMGERDNRRGKA